MDQSVFAKREDLMPLQKQPFDRLVVGVTQAINYHGMPTCSTAHVDSDKCTVVVHTSKHVTVKQSINCLCIDGVKSDTPPPVKYQDAFAPTATGHVDIAELVTESCR